MNMRFSWVKLVKNWPQKCEKQPRYLGDRGSKHTKLYVTITLRLLGSAYQNKRRDQQRVRRALRARENALRRAVSWRNISRGVCLALRALKVLRLQYGTSGDKAL